MNQSGKKLKIKKAPAKPRASRYTEAQKAYLIQYMVQHPAFAAGKLLGHEGKVNFEDQWKLLSKKLNEIEGGAEKDVAQWKVVWRDTKSHVSVKVSDKRKEAAKTGNLPATAPELSTQDKHVAQLCGRAYIEGTALVDSLPENVGLQSELMRGNEDVLDAPLEQSVSAESTYYLVNESNYVEDQENLDDYFVEGGEDDDEGATPVQELPVASTSASAKQQTMQTPRVKQPRSSIRKPNRERIGVQLESAKLSFTELFQQQNEILKGLSKAAELTASAMKMLAENDRMRVRMDAASREMEIQFEGDEEMQ